MKTSNASRHLFPLVGAAVLIMSSQVMADTVKWSELTPTEQNVLQPFAGEWDGFPEARQKTLRRWAAISPEERERIKQRYTQWKQLDSNQQKAISEQLQRYKAMSPDKRARIQAWHKWVKTLPQAEQDKLVQVWSSLSNAQRKAYLQDLRQRYGGK